MAGYEIRRVGGFPQTWVPPGHFYSPIVDINELMKDKERVFSPNHHMLDINLRESQQLEMVEKLKEFYQELPFTELKSDVGLYYYENPFYSYGDAIVYGCMLRHMQPRRLIEFGAGFSSCVALDINRMFFQNRINCTFIDPYPERLQSLLSESDYCATIIKSRAQDIDLSLFETLKPNDIVFIDSTHVSKAGSDVNFHIFELLPRLPSGTLIHFHDVFYPFEYPESWFFEENRSWNENYLLRAFLSGNASYEIIFFNDFMRLKHLPLMINTMPLFQKDPGGALWIRKSS